MNGIWIPAGISGSVALDILRAWRRYDEMPRPQRTKHRLHPFTDDCVDCGRTFQEITLDPFALCFEVTR